MTGVRGDSGLPDCNPSVEPFCELSTIDTRSRANRGSNSRMQKYYPLHTHVVKGGRSGDDEASMRVVPHTARVVRKSVAA